MHRPTHGRRLLIALALLASLGVLVAAGLGAYGLFEKSRQRKEAERQEVEEQQQAAAQDIANKVVPTSTYDATADYVDQDFKLRVKWPGPGSKVIAGEDAARMVPYAIAGVTYGGGCHGAVIPDYVPGLALADGARNLVEATPGVISSTPPAPARFAGREALTFEVQMNAFGVPLTYEHLLFNRDGWIMRISVWRTPQAKCSLAAADVVELIDGKVEGRVVLPSVPSGAGPLYRVTPALFESPAQRLRITAPPGAGFVVGEPADLIDREAATVVMGKGVTLVVISRPDPGAAIEAYTATTVRNHAVGLSLPVPAAPAENAAFGSRSLPLYVIAGPPSYETLMGSITLGDRLLTLRSVAAPSLRKEAVALIAATLAGTEVLGAAEAAKLQATMPATDAARMVAVDRALRGGRFMHHGLGLVAPLPPDPSIPDLEDPWRKEAYVLSLRRPTWGVTTSVFVEPSSADVTKAQHRVVAQHIGLEESAITAQGAPPIKAHARSTFAFLLSEIDARADIVTLRFGATSVHVVTTGYRAAVEAAHADTEKFILGIAEDQAIAVEVETTGDTLRHRRFGFELRLPGSGWTIAPEKLPMQMTALAAFTARRGHAEVAVLALNMPGLDQAFIRDFMEQSLIGKWTGKLGVPQRRDMRIVALPARQMTWPNGEQMIIVGAGDTLFVLMVSPAKGEVEPDKVFQGFKLLD